MENTENTEDTVNTEDTEDTEVNLVGPQSHGGAEALDAGGLPCRPNGQARKR
jgi:hypothetical protein